MTDTAPDGAETGRTCWCNSLQGAVVHPYGTGRFCGAHEKSDPLRLLFELSEAYQRILALQTESETLRRQAADELSRAGQEMRLDEPVNKFANWPENLPREDLVRLLRGYANQCRLAEQIIAQAFPAEFPRGDGDVIPASQRVVVDESAPDMAQKAVVEILKLRAQLAAQRPDTPTAPEGPRGVEAYEDDEDETPVGAVRLHWLQVSGQRQARKERWDGSRWIPDSMWREVDEAFIPCPDEPAPDLGPLDQGAPAQVIDDDEPGANLEPLVAIVEAADAMSEEVDRAAVGDFRRGDLRGVWARYVMARGYGNDSAEWVVRKHARRPDASPESITPARLIGPMTRRIGALGIALRNLCEAIERDDGVDMTPLWERAKAVLENNTIVTEPVDTPAATEGLPDAQAARIAQLETTLADATEALQKAPVRPATYHWERHAEERRELIRRCWAVLANESYKGPLSPLPGQPEPVDTRGGHWTVGLRDGRPQAVRLHAWTECTEEECGSNMDLPISHPRNKLADR